MHTAARSNAELLTAEDVAWRLFEEATLEGWRSSGLRGLCPVGTNDLRFRASDVAAFIYDEQDGLLQRHPVPQASATRAPVKAGKEQ